MKKKYHRDDIQSINFYIKKPSIVFLKGELGSGKTTISQHILSKILGVDKDVTSPTYTYYNKYEKNYHFDLYRLNTYEDFFLIGGEDILDNNTGVILVEWPEILEKHYEPDVEIILKKVKNEDEREIEIIKNRI